MRYRSWSSSPTRLHDSWRCPMIAITGCSSRNTLRSLTSYRAKDHRIIDLEELIYDVPLIDPLDVTRQDHMKFFVEFTPAHRSYPKRISPLVIVVKEQDSPHAAIVHASLTPVVEVF
jgi:acetyl esterase/lipase